MSRTFRLVKVDVREPDRSLLKGVGMIVGKHQITGEFGVKCRPTQMNADAFQKVQMLFVPVDDHRVVVGVDESLDCGSHIRFKRRGECQRLVTCQQGHTRAVWSARFRITVSVQHPALGDFRGAHGVMVDDDA